MRILANFTKKVATAQYENETYTVTVEAESEFNNVAEVADYLFSQARAAVQRQIDGGAAMTTPETIMPSATKHDEPEEPKAQKQAARGNVYSITPKQTGLIRRLLTENFGGIEKGNRWLGEETGVADAAQLSRKQASRIIEILMDRSRKSA